MLPIYVTHMWMATYASISYRPLLFALPILDTQDANTPDRNAPWQYALHISPANLGSDMTVERTAMPARWDWPLASPLRLRA